MENNFKGIYYNEQNDKRFYEAGAHFEYVALYNKLERLAIKLSKIRDEENGCPLEAKKSLSRNKCLVKSNSQKQLKEDNNNEFKYPLFINLPNKGNETTINKLHPRTKSEEIKNKNGTNQANSNNKQNEHYFLDKIPLNPNCGSRTRNNFNSIKPGPGSTITNDLLLQYNNNIIPNNGQTENGTNNLFLKQSSIIPKKAYCSLVKNNSTLNIHRRKDDLSGFDDVNDFSYIKENEEIKKILNNNMVPSHNFLNSNSSTIVIKPKTNFSFVNNNNIVNEHKSRNKPNDSLYATHSLKRNITPLFKSSNEIILNNCKANETISLSKTRHDFIPNGYKGNNYNKRKGYHLANGNNFGEKLSQIQKGKKMEIMLPGNDYRNSNNDHEYLIKQHQLQQSKNPKDKLYFKINNNVPLRLNSNNKRNHIPLPNKSPSYRLNNMRADNKSMPRKIHIL